MGKHGKGGKEEAGRDRKGRLGKGEKVPDKLARSPLADPGAEKKKRNKFYLLELGKPAFF